MLREAGLYFLLAVLVAVAASWPMVMVWNDHMGAPFSHPDFQVGLWWPAAVARSVMNGDPLFFQHDLNWPEGQDTRLLLWNFTAQLVFAPFVLLGNPLWGVNFITVGSMTLNAFCAAVAARWITGSRAGAVVAAMVAGASAYAFVEGVTGRPEQALWAPTALYLAGLVQVRRRPGAWGPIVACAASLALSGAIYWFYAYFLVVLTLVFAGIWVWRKDLTVAGFRDLALVGAISALLVLPFAFPVISAMREQSGFFDSMRTYAGDAALQQARSALIPRSFLGPFLLSESAYRTISGTDTHTSQVLPVLALPLAFLLMVREKGPLRLVGWAVLACALFAAGPILQLSPGRVTVFGRLGIRLPMALLNLLPGFDRLWWPYRWLGPAEAGLALAAAALVVRARRPLTWAVAIGGWSIIECMLIVRGGIAMPNPVLVKAEVPGALEAIAELPGERPILQLPMGADAVTPVGFTRWHHQPVDGGIGWGIPVVRTQGYEERRRTIPLMVAMQRIQDNGAPAPRDTPWTIEETGGFHYVLLYPGAASYGDIAHIELMVEQIGRPFYCDGTLVAWAVPGVGEVPAAWRDVPGSGEDPCQR